MSRNKKILIIILGAIIIVVGIYFVYRHLLAPEDYFPIPPSPALQADEDQDFVRRGVQLRTTDRKKSVTAAIVGEAMAFWATNSHLIPTVNGFPMLKQDQNTGQGYSAVSADTVALETVVRGKDSLELYQCLDSLNQLKSKRWVRDTCDHLGVIDFQPVFHASLSDYYLS